MRLSTNFYIDMDEFFHKQFTFAKHLYNHYNEFGIMVVSISIDWSV